MLSFHMFARTACPERIQRGESRSTIPAWSERAKLQSGRSPDLSLRPRARPLRRLQNPICIQTLIPSSQRRAIPSSFLFNPFRTLFSPRRITALNNPFGIMRFRTLSSPHRTTALNNPFGIKRFRTLSRHNGGIRVFAKKFLALPRKGEFVSPLFSVHCTLFQVPYPVTPLFATPLPREKSRGTKTTGVGINSSQNGAP
jgi:hypothetical protein